MGTRTKVSKQVKVTQGKDTITFEITTRGLAIDYTHGSEPSFILKEPGIDALRELIQPSIKTRFEEARDKATASRDEIERRFTREGAPPDASPARENTTSTPEGLTRSEDGIEGGMEQ